MVFQRRERNRWFFILLLLSFFHGFLCGTTAVAVEEVGLSQVDSAAGVLGPLQAQPPRDFVPQEQEELVLLPAYSSDIEEVIVDMQVEIKLRLRRNFLSVDGGGVKGAMVAQILKNILGAVQANVTATHIAIRGEQVPLSYILQDVVPNPNMLTLTDIFSGGTIGTSTGSFIALGIADGQPIDTIVDLYRQHAATIFRTEHTGCSHCSRNYGCVGTALFNLLRCCCCCFGGKLCHCKGVCGPRYHSRALKERLSSVFKHPNGEPKTLGDTKVPVLVMAYEVTPNGQSLEGRETPFSSVASAYAPYYIRDAGLASSAAPGVLPTHKIKRNAEGLLTVPRYFIDGALGYNNPALSAALNFVKCVIGNGDEDEDEDEFGILVSLGTGDTNKPLGYHLEGGLGDNAESLAKIMNYTSVQTAHLAAQQLLFHRNISYYRLQPSLSHDLGALDEAENVDRLIDRADEIHKKYQEHGTDTPELKDYRRIIGGLIGGEDFNRWLQKFVVSLTAE